MRSIILGATLAAALLLPKMPARAGGDVFVVDPDGTVMVDPVAAVVRVTIDFARILVVDETPSTIVIGNTGILDANLSDERTLVLTGKTPGTTNLVVLNADGEEIRNVVVEVVAAGRHVITVHQGVRRQTYSCARRCEPVLSVGDDTDFFAATQGQITARHGFADVAGSP
jgi:hypothetical protein